MSIFHFVGVFIGLVFGNIISHNCGIALDSTKDLFIVSFYQGVALIPTYILFLLNGSK